MEIKQSTIDDIDGIFRLYALAAEYQREKKKVIVWPVFERALVETEIQENRQWKIMIDGVIACVWATTFSDEKIWESRNADPAVYIHRIATNPLYRGQKFVTLIVDWARQFAKQHHKGFIRLDTIGNNEGLIRHYQEAGFTSLGLHNLSSTEGLPPHYKVAPACLCEIRI